MYTNMRLEGANSCNSLQRVEKAINVLNGLLDILRSYFVPNAASDVVSVTCMCTCHVGTLFCIFKMKNS